jgi:MFS family permease
VVLKAPSDDGYARPIPAAAEEFERQQQAADEAAKRQQVFEEQLQQALQGKDIAPRLASSALALDYLPQQVRGRQDKLWDQVTPEANRLAQAQSRLRSAEDSLTSQAPVREPAVPRRETSIRNLRRILLVAAAVAAAATGVLLVGHFALSAGWATAWLYLAIVTGVLCLLLLASQIAMVIVERRPPAAPDSWDSAARDAAKARADEIAYANSQVELAQTQLADALRTRAIEPMLRSLANEVLGPSYSTELGVRYSPGLSEVFDARYEVSTKAARDLSSVISMIKGGSIGLAGPRGCGKTTLIESVCEGRTKALPSEMVSLKVSAPVEYEPRDFILYLFSRLCREFTGSVSYEAVRDDSDDERSYFDRQGARLRGYARRRILYAAFAVGIVSMSLGVLQFVFPSAPWMNGASLIAIGIAIFFITYAVLSWATVALRRTRRDEDVDRRPVYFSLVSVPGLISIAGLVSSAAFIALGILRILRILRPAPAASHGAQLIAIGVGIPLATYVGLSLAILLRRLRETPAVAPYVAPELQIADPSKLEASLGSSEDAFRALQRTALEHLGDILYQQTYTSGWSGTLKVPIAELAGNIGKSQARQPMTYPEVAAALRQFLKDIADSFRPVMIGIDELDKMESGDKARQFLNEIKSIFGVQGCYFLVSVSMDAMSSFERRGMPFRDAFDSSFDDIILVQPLNYEDARSLINRRVIGMANPFIALAHVISGGLARDVIRSTRKQVALATETSRYDIASISRGVVADEVRAKLVATETALQEDRTSTQRVRFVELRETLDPADAASLLETARSLMPSVPKAGSPDVPGAGSPGAPKAGLLQELAAYLYFAATVVDFFGGSFSEQRLRDAESSGLLDKLANSRRTFTLGPEAAWAQISECRHACRFTELPPWPDENGSAAHRPGDRSAAGLPAVMENAPGAEVDDQTGE